MTIPSDFISANLIMMQCYARLAQPGELPADKLGQLEAIVSGVIQPERVSEFFEFGYANRADLSETDCLAFADVGAFAWSNAFWGLSVDARGMAMETLLRGGELPEGIAEPVPSSKYAPPQSPAITMPGIAEG